jgi:SAM-dependent methyltransferase
MKLATSWFLSASVSGYNQSGNGRLKMSQANSAQADYWSSASGYQWIAQETFLDAALATILDRLLERADIRPKENLLDVGCGTGASTLAAAAKTGPKGHVTGLDIAEQLLDRARKRSDDAGLRNTSFILGDAQTYPFDTESFDAIISRFGLMFFNDPVAAFGNMARGLKSKGRLVFPAWAPAAENPWFLIPRDAAIARLGKPAPADPFAPGPLAFQDRERVIKLMEQAGLNNVRGETEVVPLTLLVTAAEAAKAAASIGPAARIMKEFSGTEADAIAIEAAVAEAFVKFENPKGVSVPATIHFFSAGRA